MRRFPLDVAEGHVHALIQKSGHLGSENQRLRAARACAEAHVALHLRVVTHLGDRRTYQARHVLFDRWRDDHLPHEVLQAADVRFHVPLEYGRRSRLVGSRGLGENPTQLGDVGIVQIDLEEKAIELRFGQRVGALHLDRIQRGQDEERRR